jgi:hypothetical protein
VEQRGRWQRREREQGHPKEEGWYCFKEALFPCISARGFQSRT